MKGLRQALLATAMLQLAVLVYGGVSLRADADCGVQCDLGGSVTCSATGSGCTCTADSSPGGGCSAACAEGGGEPDEKECPDREDEG